MLLPRYPFLLLALLQVLQAQEHYCSFEESCVNAEFDTSSDNDQIKNRSKPATAEMHENNVEDENNVDGEEEDSEDEEDDDDEEDGDDEDEEDDDSEEDDDDDDHEEDDDDESNGEYEDGEMPINLMGKPQIVREIEREATLKVREKSKEYMTKIIFQNNIEDENNVDGEEDDSEDEEDDDDEDDSEDYDEEEDDDDEYYGEYEDGEMYINLWGKPQIVREIERKATLKALEKSKEYMANIVFVEEKYEFIRHECRNLHQLCSFWAGQGDCEGLTEYMVENCSPACLSCDVLEDEFDEDSEDEFDYENQPTPAETGGELVQIPWGVAQNLGKTFSNKVRALMDETSEYMMNEVYKEELYKYLMMECENRGKDCSIWAAFGLCECEKNKAYMSVNCAPACQTCDKLDFENRCPFDPDAPQAWEKPGDLNRMFERITTDPYWETYGPISVISSPATTGGPWVLTLDNFLSDEECERLIETGYEEGYEISADVGKVSFDGTHESVRSEGRTSENAWCDDECSDDPITGPVQERIEKLSGIHYNNSEWLQLLKYEPGQFYMEHHDYIPHEAEGRPQGPRIMTVFLYLNDVEAGGGTRFGRMGVTVMPKKGRVLIWPSVLDEDPSEMDEQTLHEALPVEAGVKYGANAWIHQRDFKTPFEENCV